MGKTTLVICPTCEMNNRKQVLGEVMEDGSFSVMRFHQSTTRIQGDEFKIYCGICGDEVYRKEARNEGTLGSIGFAWVHRIEFGTPFGTIRA